MNSKVKDGNFITIQSFMITELKLKGNELLVYAIIYGFSQADGQYFNGSLQYLADWTNSTKQGIFKNLKSLIEKGLLEKIEKEQLVYYKANRTIKQSLIVNNVNQSTKFNATVKQSLIDDKQSLMGVKQSLPNTIIYNNNINNNTTNTNINSNSLVSDNSLYPKENIRSIKLALQNHGLGIETCKNIMELVYAKKVDLPRIKQVLVVAQMKQWRDGAIYQALRDNWNLETPESATPEVAPNPEELSAKISWLKKFAGIWGDKELRTEFEKLVINIPLELLEKNRSKMGKMTIFEMKNCLINLKKGA